MSGYRTGKAPAVSTNGRLCSKKVASLCSREKDFGMEGCKGPKGSEFKVIRDLD